MEAHEIIGQVHEAFPKLPVKVARIRSVSAEMIRSHHREPKSRNPLGSGNTSPVTAYMEYVHQYEGGEGGAGRMLNNRVYASINAELDEGDEIATADHFDAVAEESLDVEKWLARHDLNDATPNQIAGFEREVLENLDALNRALTDARRIRRLKESGISLAK